MIRWLEDKWNSRKTSDRYLNRALIIMGVFLVVGLIAATIETC